MRMVERAGRCDDPDHNGKRRCWMRKSLLLGCAAMIGLGGLAYVEAHAQANAPAAPAGPAIPLPADAIIAARQAGYDLQAGVVMAMKTVIDVGGDVKGLEDGAKGLSKWGHVIPTMFPDGTQTGHETKARPEIWSDRAGFEKAAANFWTAADKLATLAEANDKAGFATQYTATTQACGACHRAYRVRTN